MEIFQQLYSLSMVIHILAIGVSQEAAATHSTNSKHQNPFKTSNYELIRGILLNLHLLINLHDIDKLAY